MFNNYRPSRLISTCGRDFSNLFGLFLLEHTMEYIEITKWDTFQHYKHRNPPWIKLYSYLLDNDEFDCLPDASKLLYFCLLLFASRRDNKIKLDFKWLQRKLPIEKTITKDTMQPLIDNGFIACKQGASNPQAGSKQNALPEKSKVKKRREEKTKTKKPLDFSLTENSIKKLFSDELKPETGYETNTLNKLARYCDSKKESLPNLYIYLIDTIADLKEDCKVKAKNHGDLMRMFVAKIQKDLK